VYSSKACGTVFYSPSIATMVVSLAVYEIFSVKQWHDLEIGLEVTQVIGNGTIRAAIDRLRVPIHLSL